MTNKTKVIYDCDPGYDDAFAMAYMHHADAFEVLMVSSVAGNVGIEHTTRNLRGLVHTMGWDVELCQGASGPMLGEQIVATIIHGDNGLFGYHFSDEELAQLSPRNFLEASISLLENSLEPITIIATGPLTNIASLMIYRPDLASKIKEICIMGGGIAGGNWTMCAEFNILADPEAAQIVFNVEVPIRMAVLDVTNQAKFTLEDLKNLQKSKRKINQILAYAASKSFEQPAIRERGFIRLHDVVAVMALLHPEFFQTQKLYVQVETEGRMTRGMTVSNRLDWNKMPPNAEVILGLDHSAFIRNLMETLLK
ncbi:MAG: nucleoside hydrolase [Anaerolineaceae bacterium]|nr:nucleoside hydrolase [Anaerolineaceae bacterium]